MRKTLVIFAAAALLIGSASAASAQGMGRGMGMGRGPVAQACATEIGRYCSQLRHGGGQVRSCLQSHVQAASPGCRSALGHTGYGARWR